MALGSLGIALVDGPTEHGQGVPDPGPIGRPGAEVVQEQGHLLLDPIEQCRTGGGDAQVKCPLVPSGAVADQQPAAAERLHRRADGRPPQLQTFGHTGRPLLAAGDRREDPVVGHAELIGGPLHEAGHPGKGADGLDGARQVLGVRGGRTGVSRRRREAGRATVGPWGGEGHLVMVRVIVRTQNNALALSAAGETGAG